MRLSKIIPALLAGAAFSLGAAADGGLKQSVAADYTGHLADLYKHFHSHPELSFVETKTAARIAEELRAVGFEVTEGVGRTGIVAILKNGDGPMVAMRADMDGLPVKELVDIPYASNAVQVNDDGQEFPVMHACGHDVHITSLVGTGRAMAARRDEWSGTLMLIGQPAEEWKVSGAKAMKDDNIWERFGTPDYALAFHVAAGLEAGVVVASEGAAYSAVDSVDIIVPGVGAHGASPHKGIDPVVIGSQIVVNLQTITSRTLSPREPGVVTVGVFKAGNKRNVIGEEARLELTVRSDSKETRKKLLDGIRRIAVNTGEAMGLPADNPVRVEVVGGIPVTANDPALARRLKAVWAEELGDRFNPDFARDGMGGEDFAFFTENPYIPSVYFQVGGTPKADLEAEQNGGKPVPSHHSPIFYVSPDEAVPSGVEATVVALKDLMPVTSGR